MMKKLTSLLIAVLLCFALTISVFAESTAPRLVDGADILFESEEQVILSKLNYVSEEHNFDVIVITVESLPESVSSAKELADSIYAGNDFGFGDQKDGIIFLVSMLERDWTIYAKGYGETVFTDSGLEYIAGIVQPMLSDGDYSGAFESFADECDSFLFQATSGTPFDESNLPRQSLSVTWIPISILIGMGISLLIMSVFRSKLKSVRSKSNAHDYQVAGSFRVTHSSEIFLYQNVTRIPRQTQSTTKPGGARSGSSGRSIGGKF